MKKSLLAPIPPRLLAWLPAVGLAALIALPSGCGGGGGGVSSTLPFGTATITIANDTGFDLDGLADLSCTGGDPTPTFTITSVTITDTFTGDYETYVFPVPIPQGSSSPFLHPITAGASFSFEVTWSPSGRPTTDQCPINPVTTAVGANTVTFEY